MTNLLLASAMAIRYGERQEVAVKRAAKAMRNQTQLESLKGIARKILNADPRGVRDLIKRLHESMIWEGLLDSSVGAYYATDKTSPVLQSPGR